MAAYREVGTQPPQDAGQRQHGSRVAAAQEGEPEVRPVGRGERRHLVVEEGERCVDERESNGAARQALQQAGVIERPAHEGIGRAEELRDLDLLALRKDLQPDGVESDGDERRSE